jgi:hypothetical protein
VTKKNVKICAGSTMCSLVPDAPRDVRSLGDGHAGSRAGGPRPQKPTIRTVSPAIGTWDYCERRVFARSDWRRATLLERDVFPCRSTSLVECL